MQVSARVGFGFAEPSGSSQLRLCCLHGQGEPGPGSQLPRLVQSLLCARHGVQTEMEEYK